MNSRPFVVLIGIAAVALAGEGRAQTPSSSTSTTSSSASRPTGRAARGPLPDPALLDGSTQAPEKKSEYGMLGEFEIPGDENAKGDKPGGQQPPAGKPAGGGKQDPNAKQGQSGGSQGAMPPGVMAQGGGGGVPESGQQPPKNGGSPGGPGGGKDDPNAKAEGRQVGELKTDEAAGGAAPDAAVQKPSQVAIGDPAMQIKPAPNAPGIIGATTPAGNTQQMEKPTGGSGGKGTSGDNNNRGVEKGRVVPAGL